jgi:hypothetical protein
MRAETAGADGRANIFRAVSERVLRDQRRRAVVPM